MLYRLFHGQLAGRLVFIAPAIVATAGLLALRARVSSSPCDAVGLDMEVLRASGCVTLAAGLVWSGIFHRYRNILPIGVAHGLLGALFYYLVLERDVIASLV